MKQINDTLKTSINWQTSTKTEKEEKVHKLTISGMKRGSVVTDSANMKGQKRKAMKNSRAFFVVQ